MRQRVAGAAGLVVMWSSGFVGARLGTAHAPADTLLAWRYLVVAVLVGLAAAVRRPRFPAREVRGQAVLGLLCQAGYLGGVVTGVGLGVPAGVAALVAVLQPLVVGALAGPVLGQRVRPRQWLGLVFGFAGVAVVVAGDLEGDGHVLGYVLVFAGMLSLSAGTLLERRWALPTSSFDTLTLHCLTSCVVFVAAAGVTGHLAPPMTGGFWFAVGWVVVLSTFGGYGCYLLSLRAFGATGASTLLFLTPPTTMVWALLMFGEPVRWTTALGLAGCAAAVWLVLAGPGKVRWIHRSRPGRSTRPGDGASPSRPSAPDSVPATATASSRSSSASCSPTATG